MSEVSLDVHYDSCDDYKLEKGEARELRNSFYGGISSQELPSGPLTRKVHHIQDTDPTAIKIISQIKPLMSKASGEIRLEAQWGGENGVEVSGSASASASDYNGNTAEVEVNVNDDGSGSVNVSAKHEEDS